MRAVLVCVGYEDILSITYPRNRHHFEDVLVVTSKADEAKVRSIAENVYATDTFFADGATFGKWQALEEALDRYGREGWLCIMDADVIWPERAPLHLEIGKLVTPLRRMLEAWPRQAVPPESEWHRFPVHRNIYEWAGYSQIFHADDPVLGLPPWHEVDWKHAGGADSFFQQKWKPKDKLRPTWECLHLGPAGQNWYGRATMLADGRMPEDYKEKRAAIARIWEGRRRGLGFSPEKLT